MARYKIRKITFHDDPDECKPYSVYRVFCYWDVVSETLTLKEAIQDKRNFIKADKEQGNYMRALIQIIRRGTISFRIQQSKQRKG